MSELSISCSEVFTLEGLDKQDLGILISGLHSIKDDLTGRELVKSIELNELDKILSLLEVMKK